MSDVRVPYRDRWFFGDRQNCVSTDTFVTIDPVRAPFGPASVGVHLRGLRGPAGPSLPTALGPAALRAPPGASVLTL